MSSPFLWQWKLNVWVNWAALLWLFKRPLTWSQGKSIYGQRSSNDASECWGKNEGSCQVFPAASWAWKSCRFSRQPTVLHLSIPPQLKPRWKHGAECCFEPKTMPWKEIEQQKEQVYKPQSAWTEGTRLTASWEQLRWQIWKTYLWHTAVTKLIC